MISKNAKLWTYLANECETPGEFIRYVMNLRNENSITLGEKLGTTPSYISMVINNKSFPGIDACYKYAKALNIDPYLLARVASDYKMKKIIEENELRPYK